MDLPSARNRRLIVLAMLAVAASVFAIAVVVTRANPGSTPLPTAVQSVDPEPGTNVLRQSSIVVDLAVGFTAELEVNGSAVPSEQLFVVDALNQLTFQPGPGAVVETLLPDQNCVRLTYWPIATGRDDRQVYSWCFNAS